MLEGIELAFNVNEPGIAVIFWLPEVFLAVGIIPCFGAIRDENSSNSKIKVKLTAIDQVNRREP